MTTTDAEAPVSPASTVPLFAVTSGNPSDEEVAALTAVITTLAQSDANQCSTGHNANRQGRPGNLAGAHPSAFRHVSFF